MKTVDNNKRGPIDGVEIYAKKIINDGMISSDTYSKIITEDYAGRGSVVSEATTETKPGVIKGVFFEVGGNMQQDGVIKTDKDAIVDMRVRGSYSSKKGKIIQGEELRAGWHTTWWGVSVLGIIVGVIVAWLIYIIGWNK